MVLSYNAIMQQIEILIFLFVYGLGLKEIFILRVSRKIDINSYILLQLIHKEFFKVSVMENIAMK